MEIDSKIQSLIVSYLENSISKSDLNKLDEWLESDPMNRVEFDNFQNIWIATETADNVTDNVIADEWESLKEIIENEPKQEVNSLKPKQSIWNQLARIAAVFIAGALVSWGAMEYIEMQNLKDLKITEISAPYGAKSLINLPDGSKVWLNAGSRINYLGNFGEKNREVELEGEAFFEVAKDKSKMFMVKTTDVVVKAYGTSFNVKSYADERTIEATLVEGKIGISRNSLRKSGKDEVILKQNQRVIFYKETAKFAKVKGAVNALVAARPKSTKLKYVVSKGIDPQMFTSWKENRLMINSETLGAVAIKLERKYDINIHFDNEELKKIKFTGTIKKETIEQVLNAIKLASSISYRIDESDVWLFDSTGKK